jgi:hypothetical protein
LEVTLDKESDRNQFLKDDLADAEKMIETLKLTLKEFTLKKEGGDPFYNYDETYEKVLRNEFEQMRDKY